MHALLFFHFSARFLLREQMGTVLLYLFFATAGASGTGVATTLVGAGVPLLGFLSIVYAVHFGVVRNAVIRSKCYHRTVVAQ